MRRIAISAGHSNEPGKDNGAFSILNIDGVPTAFTEGHLTVELRNLIIEEAKKRDIVINKDGDKSVTFQTVALFKQWFRDKDIVIDIHFNAVDNPSASGTLCIVPKSSTSFERSLAGELAATISAAIGCKNRGVITEKESARKKLLFMTIPAENVLIEVCFITNFSDMFKYKNNKKLVAKAIVEILEKYRNV